VKFIVPRGEVTLNVKLAALDHKLSMLTYIICLIVILRVICFVESLRLICLVPHLTVEVLNFITFDELDFIM